MLEEQDILVLSGVANVACRHACQKSQGDLLIYAGVYLGQLSDAGRAGPGGVLWCCNVAIRHSLQKNQGNFC